MEAGRKYEAYVSLINQRLDQLIPPATAIPAKLHEAMRYSCLAPGKRLRPALTLACAEAAGGSSSAALDAACAVEMVHAFSLIHDDLPAIDNDDLRRGRPTCHVVYGEAIAILAGDALFALAFEVLASAEADPTRTVFALKSLTQAVGSDGLVGGEVIDVLSEGSPVDEATLMLIHERKTGALIRSACELGALYGGGGEKEITYLRAYGDRIGLAFQIVDDVLNETSTAEELGKAAGSDQARMKATYPSLLGLDRSKQIAQSLANDAQNLLKELPGDTEFLAYLARYAVDRTR